MNDYVLYGLLLLAAVFGFFKFRSVVTSSDAKIRGQRNVKDLKRKDVVLIIVGTIVVLGLLVVFNFW